MRAILMAGAVSLAATVASAQTNMLFILDASNSMWGQAGGEAKIDTAKRVLGEALGDLGSEVTPGLMVYGHRARGECTDVELVAPIGAADAGAIRAYIQGLSPKGKTPIAASLERAASAFNGREEENNSILLISDGIETCSGDPCAVAQALAERGINVKVNVVGFDVDAEARAQLQCIAEKGGGRYFDAKNANDFTQAVAEAREAAKAPPPPPKPAPKVPKVWFEDHFDGTALSADWEVLNEDPDNYLVENGVLTLVVRDKVTASYGNAPNVLRLTKGLPKGDWTATMRFTVDPQTFGEVVRLGVAKDHENSLFAALWMNTDNYARTVASLWAEKLTKGEKAEFVRPIFTVESRTLRLRQRAWQDKVTAVQLRLTKTKRNYTAALRFEPVPGTDLSDEWFTVQDLSSLRAPGDAFAVIFGSQSSGYAPDAGEGAIAIDWIRIEQPG